MAAHIIEMVFYWRFSIKMELVFFRLRTWMTAQHFGIYRKPSNWYSLLRLLSCDCSDANWELVNRYGSLPSKQVLLSNFSHFPDGRRHRMEIWSSHGFPLVSLVILRKLSVLLMGFKSNDSSSGLSSNGNAAALKSAITAFFQNSWAISKQAMRRLTISTNKGHFMCDWDAYVWEC